MRQLATILAIIATLLVGIAHADIGRIGSIPTAKNAIDRFELQKRHEQDRFDQQILRLTNEYTRNVTQHRNDLIRTLNQIRQAEGRAERYENAATITQYVEQLQQQAVEGPTLADASDPRDHQPRQAQAQTRPIDELVGELRFRDQPGEMLIVWHTGDIRHYIDGVPRHTGKVTSPSFEVFVIEWEQRSGPHTNWVIRKRTPGPGSRWHYYIHSRHHITEGEQHVGDARASHIGRPDN